jgi:nucleosome binding factor SPN SPT16 subunit
MADVVIDAALFATRLKKLHANFVANKESNWNGCDSLVIAMGASSEEDLNYSKSSALHLYLLGFEFSDSVMILTKTTFCFMATNKKCGYVEAAIQSHPVEGIKFEFFRKTKDEGANRENFNAMLGVCRKAGNKVGTLVKANHEGTFIPLWTDALTNSNIPIAEIAPSLAVFFAVKDEVEMESCKRAAVLTNKVMKHGFVTEMEKILDDGSRVTHEAVAKEVCMVFSVVLQFSESV